MPPEELRDINPLPVDAVLVSLPGNPSEWTLQDLSAVARVSGRVGKHMLVEISGAPDGDALESLRNAGVAGLVVGLSLGEEAISGLKDALLNMPRPRRRPPQPFQRHPARLGLRRPPSRPGRRRPGRRRLAK